MCNNRQTKFLHCPQCSWLFASQQDLTGQLSPQNGLSICVQPLQFICSRKGHSLHKSPHLDSTTSNPSFLFQYSAANRTSICHVDFLGGNRVGRLKQSLSWAINSLDSGGGAARASDVLQPDKASKPCGSGAGCCGLSSFSRSGAAGHGSVKIKKCGARKRRRASAAFTFLPAASAPPRAAG